jgi:hypothetical protein
MRKLLFFLLLALMVFLYARLDQMREEQEWLEATDALFR